MWAHLPTNIRQEVVVPISIPRFRIYLFPATKIQKIIKFVNLILIHVPRLLHRQIRKNSRELRVTE